jgi:hypothetical protein
LEISDGNIHLNVFGQTFYVSFVLGEDLMTDNEVTGSSSPSANCNFSKIDVKGKMTQEDLTKDENIGKLFSIWISKLFNLVLFF